MFNIFKSSESGERPKDVKEIRDVLLRFIKDQLQKVDGGEGRYIKGLQLFLAAGADDKHLYEAAISTEDSDRFKNEVQKIANDFAIDLPDNWTMEITFVDELPTDAIKVQQLEAALLIRTKSQILQKISTAYVRVLSGEAEKEEYTITSNDLKINIGRDKKAQVDDGFFRTNTIAFPGNSANQSNKYISRRHAHIEWNNDAGCFLLFADEGGVPPLNKIKIRAVNNDDLVKLNSTIVGHQLKEGDQIILGESAVIEFSYISASVNG